MFKKALIALSIAAIGAASAVAQAQPVDDHKTGEFYVGYSNGQVDTGVDTGNSVVDFFRDRENFNGVNVSGVYNTSRFFGIKGDVSATFNKNEFTDTFTTGGLNYTVGYKDNNSLYNFVGGVQVKDNANSGVFKPFAHAMVGAAHARTKITDFTCVAPVGGNCAPLEVDDETFSTTGFSTVIGGGIDFRLNNRVQVRAIQFDYNPTRLEGSWQNNIRIGAGIVF